LVQQIFNISNDGSSALKLTTAKYYVPSGRCIQRTDRQSKNPASHPTVEEEADTLVISEREIFYTNAGRIVYGGGGIVPDVEIEGESWKPIEINLERQSMFFDFAIEYVSSHPETKQSFEVSDDVVNQFSEFIKEKEFDYKSALQVALEELQETIVEEEREDIFQENLDEMAKLIETDKSDDFVESNPYIKRAIKREVVRAIFGDRGHYEQVVLKDDKTVKKAIEILSSPSEYTRLISEGQKKAEL